MLYKYNTYPTFATLIPLLSVEKKSIDKRKVE